ncbi:hypothetical protein [Emticicia sp. W12TSBA100-4]|uniref:hypothetical protein n=1 Tax=Emticicia sp. W12TSBA100-4 TaxID=3160965 RepID=UPI0033067724
MQITYQLNEEELTYEFFKALKKTLKGKVNVEFSIKAEESPYKMSKEAFEEKILNSEKSDNQYVFEGDEFEKFTQKVLNREELELNLYSRQK